ncbi:MAG: hydrogenase 4 subunit B [Thalassobaculales bacterium]
MTAALALILCCAAILLATAVLAVALGRRAAAGPVIYGAALAASALAGGLALAHLLTGAAPSLVTLPLGLPWLGAQFRLDGLAAFFLTVIGGGGAMASLYGLGHGRHALASQRVLPFFPAFLAGMVLVVLADDAFAFLVAWEFMSLSSWALVLAHHRDAGNARAGYVYLVMAGFGTFSLLLAFGLLAGADGAYAFAAIRAADHGPLTAGLAFVLVLLGAGSKAGLVPLHVWLPLAHPAAPSHVSALMSAVMTKVAVYGFIRIVFDLMAGRQWWAGALLIGLGGLSAALGILHALMERDLKRVLAYSTIENIGVIFAALGLALAFQAGGMNAAAALAMTAALLHVANHSLFKNLLFLGAGAVLAATGTRDMERLGGLIQRMPLTALAMLVGCVAIAALPPLNGFVSEWLVFQAILQSPALPNWGLKVMVPALGGVLALAAALAAACFVRVYGIAFLGRPRAAEAAAVAEAEGGSLLAMGLLALACLLVGILPGPVIDALAPVSLALAGDRLPPQSVQPWLSLVPMAAAGGSYNGLLVFAFIAATAGLAALVLRRLGPVRARRAPAWACGFDQLVPAAQYSASSFAQPIRRVFAGLALRAREKVAMPAPGDPAPARFAVTLRDPVWDGLYSRLAGAVGHGADRLNHLQFLTIRRYLGMVFLSLVALLLALAVAS